VCAGRLVRHSRAFSVVHRLSKEACAMRHRSLGGACLGVLSLALLPSPLWAQQGKADTPADAKQGPAKARTPKIDKYIPAKRAENKVKPVTGAPDGEFVRRLYLDLAGRIPNILEIRDFVDREEPNKRELLVDALLNNETYSRHFANFWRDLLVSNSN